jgi:hypothetical protein
MKILVVSATVFNEVFNKLSPMSRVCNSELPTANLMFRAQNVLMVVDSEVSIEEYDPNYPLNLAALALPSGEGFFRTIKERVNG